MSELLAGMSKAGNPCAEGPGGAPSLHRPGFGCITGISQHAGYIAHVNSMSAKPG
ncbi:hypothetical protein DM44_6979 [Burkholderia cepacia]|nr:hypothetical protein DM44_6979 [Burkholderia cepacia]